MSLTPLNFNSNGAPEPSEDNTITLREYTGGPIAQFDAEQNFINFKGRINDLLNSVSNLTSTVSGNQSSINTQISDLSTTLTNSINSSNAAQDATIASNLSSITSLSEKVTNLQNADNNLNTSDATFGDTVNGVPSIEIDDDNGASIRGPVRVKDTDGSYASLTTSSLAIVNHPDGGENSGSSTIFNGEALATPEEKLIIDPLPGRVVELRRGVEIDGDLEVSGSISGASFTGLNDNIASFISPSICTNGFTNSAGVAGALRFWHDNDWMNPGFNGLSINPLTKEVYERYYWHINFGKEAFYSRSNNTFYNPHGYSSPSAVMWDNSTPPTFSTSNVSSGLVRILFN